MDSKYLEIAFLLLLAGGGITLATDGRIFSFGGGDQEWIEMEKPAPASRKADSAADAAIAAAPAAEAPSDASPDDDTPVATDAMTAKAAMPKAAMPKAVSVTAGGGGKDETLLERAERYKRAEEFENAEKTYREILKKNGKSAKAYLGLGELYMQRGDYPEATAMFNQAALIFKENKELH